MRTMCQLKKLKDNHRVMVFTSETRYYEAEIFCRRRQKAAVR